MFVEPADVGTPIIMYVVGRRRNEATYSNALCFLFLLLPTPCNHSKHGTIRSYVSLLSLATRHDRGILLKR